MNNSAALDTLNSEIEEPCDSIICKRKSSVFQSRRSILFIEEEKSKAKKFEDDESLSINDNKRQCVEDVRRKENFDLQKYINNLSQERKMWQTTLKERKSERRTLSKQKSSLEQLGQNSDLKVLSDSERSFLFARPDYKYIYENSQKLSIVGLKINLLNELIYKLNGRFMSRMREKLHMATKKIIEMSG